MVPRWCDLVGAPDEGLSKTHAIDAGIEKDYRAKKFNLGAGLKMISNGTSHLQIVPYRKKLVNPKQGEYYVIAW